MKRFIRYLYEYEKDKRIRNVGFIKIEAGCDETIVHLQAKGFHDGDERRLVLYLFYEENGELVVFPQGEICLTSPVLSWDCAYSVEDTCGQENYLKICGILIETGSGRRIAATWDDRCVNVSKLKEFKEEAELNAVEESGRESESNGMEAQGNEDYAQPEGLQLKYTKISRQELSKLPHCEWKLANNRFLIHGYNNFHHLLLIDNGNYLKLGVPGIYHIKEARWAREFGFEEFISADELGNFFTEYQENDGQIFGYWCRRVRKRRE